MRSQVLMQHFKTTTGIMCGLFLVFTLFGSIQEVHAQGSTELRPAAVVNDEVISALDLSMRIRLALLTTGTEDTPEARRQIGPPVLRALIDEKLQVQEAERLEIQVGSEDIQAGVEQVAQQNGMQANQLLQVLKDNGVLPNTFIEQIRANLMWNRLIRVRIEPQIVVTEEDVNAELEKLRADAGKQERLVREIYFSIDNPNEEPQARASAEQTLQQLSEGSSFVALAQQYSQSATAATGGSLGWVLEGELAPELEQALEGMEPGAIAGPVRTVDGYYILGLERVRTVEASEDYLRMVQVQFALEGNDEQTVRAQANSMMSDVQSCAQAQEIANQLDAGENAQMPETALSDLPQNVQEAVASLEVGEPSAPVLGDDGLTVYVVCLRNSSGLSRERIADAIAREQLDLQIRRYMRDLRRTANIDIRI